MGAQEAGMATFSVQRAPDDAPRSSGGVASRGRYDGPHGPAFAGYGEDNLTTCVGAPTSQTPCSNTARTAGWTANATVCSHRSASGVGEVVGEVVQPYPPGSDVDGEEFTSLSLPAPGSTSLSAWSTVPGWRGRTARSWPRRPEPSAPAAIALDADAVEVAVVLAMNYGVSTGKLTLFG